MAINPTSFPMPQAFSGGVDFSPLANLGNVYRQGQEQDAQRRVLGQLGTDSAANAQLLATSGVPSLATLGMTMQQQQAREKQRIAEFERTQTRLEEPEYEIKSITNPDTGETQLVRIKKQGPEGPIQTGIPQQQPSPSSGLSGDEFLSSLSEGRANLIKGIAEGRIAPPTGFAQKSPQVQALLRQVAQYEPDFDLTLWKSRNAMQTNATSGKIGQNIASFNTAIGHIDNLDKSIEDLDNSRFPFANRPLNFIASQFDPQTQIALKNFNGAKTAVIDELTRAFRGTGGNVHDLVEWEKEINDSDSPQALHAATKKVTELLRSRIEALGDQYNRGMQFKVPKEPLDLLSPKSKEAIQRISEGVPKGSAVPSPQPATQLAAPAVTPMARGPEYDAALVAARKAIADRKDPAKVRQRLVEHGIDPEDL
jgi:hypothetical protein